MGPVSLSGASALPSVKPDQGQQRSFVLMGHVSTLVGTAVNAAGGLRSLAYTGLGGRERAALGSRPCCLPKGPSLVLSTEMQTPGSGTSLSWVCSSFPPLPNSRPMTEG